MITAMLIFSLRQTVTTGITLRILLRKSYFFDPYIDFKIV